MFDGDPLGCWDDAIRQRFFFRDEEREVIRTPEAMLEGWEDGAIEGDCDCVSTLFAAGALVLGVSGVRFVATRTLQNEPQYTHVYAEALDRGGWRRFDQTVPPDVVPVEIDYGRMVEYV